MKELGKIIWNIHFDNQNHIDLYNLDPKPSDNYGQFWEDLLNNSEQSTGLRDTYFLDEQTWSWRTGMFQASTSALVPYDPDNRTHQQNSAMVDRLCHVFARCGAQIVIRWAEFVAKSFVDPFIWQQPPFSTSEFVHQLKLPPVKREPIFRFFQSVGNRDSTFVQDITRWFDEQWALLRRTIDNQDILCDDLSSLVEIAPLRDDALWAHFERRDANLIVAARELHAQVADLDRCLRLCGRILSFLSSPPTQFSDLLDLMDRRNTITHWPAKDIVNNEIVVTLMQSMRDIQSLARRVQSSLFRHFWDREVTGALSSATDFADFLHQVNIRTKLECDHIEHLIRTERVTWEHFETVFYPSFKFRISNPSTVTDLEAFGLQNQEAQKFADLLRIAQAAKTKASFFAHVVTVVELLKKNADDAKDWNEFRSHVTELNDMKQDALLTSAKKVHEKIGSVVPNFGDDNLTRLPKFFAQNKAVIQWMFEKEWLAVDVTFNALLSALGSLGELSFGLLDALRWARPFIRGLAEPSTYFGVMSKLLSMQLTPKEYNDLQDVRLNLNELEKTSRRTGESQVERDTRDMNSVLFHGSLCVGLPSENLSPDLDVETDKLINVKAMPEEVAPDMEQRIFEYSELFELQERLQLMGGSNDVGTSAERFIHKLETARRLASIHLNAAILLPRFRGVNFAFSAYEAPFSDEITVIEAEEHHRNSELNHLMRIVARTKHDFPWLALVGSVEASLIFDAISSPNDPNKQIHLLNLWQAVNGPVAEDQVSNLLEHTNDTTFDTSSIESMLKNLGDFFNRFLGDFAQKYHPLDDSATNLSTVNQGQPTLFIVDPKAKADIFRHVLALLQERGQQLQGRNLLVCDRYTTLDDVANLVDLSLAAGRHPLCVSQLFFLLQPEALHPATGKRVARLLEEQLVSSNRNSNASKSKFAFAVISA
jgi:hypothetical protein